jgi:hypothetical protein
MGGLVFLKIMIFIKFFNFCRRFLRRKFLGKFEWLSRNPTVEDTINNYKLKVTVEDTINNYKLKVTVEDTINNYNSDFPENSAAATKKYFKKSLFLILIILLYPCPLQRDS